MSKEIVFIVDRSGSMSSISSAMESAMAEVIQNQKKESEEDTLITFVRFDDVYEEVFSEKSISDIDGFKISPRNLTALLDAIGKTVNTFERRYNSKSDEMKPERVLFIIITDGLENASKEFSRNQIFEIIEKVKRDYNWGFTFIGANQDSIAEGNSIGVVRGSSLNYEATAKGVRCMAESMSSYVGSYMTNGFASYENKNEE